MSHGAASSQHGAASICIVNSSAPLYWEHLWLLFCVPTKKGRLWCLSPRSLCSCTQTWACDLCTHSQTWDGGVQKRERLASRGDCPLIHQRTMACQYIPAFQNKLRQCDSNSNDSKFWLCGLTNKDRYRCKSVWGCPGVPTHPHWPGGTPRLTWFPAAAPVPATTPACVVWSTFAL